MLVVCSHVLLTHGLSPVDSFASVNAKEVVSGSIKLTPQ